MKQAMDGPTRAKAELRALMRERRAAVDGRVARSTAICARLAASELYRRARAIHCYLPINTEVDTLPLIEHALGENKKVAVPVVLPGEGQLQHVWLGAGGLGDLAAGAFGTRHPQGAERCDPAACDLFVVPLLAFDRSGRRLGYGKGYYDRLLAAVAAPAVGVAFGAQEVAALPGEEHDVALAAIITEDEIVWP